MIGIPEVAVPVSPELVFSIGEIVSIRSDLEGTHIVLDDDNTVILAAEVAIVRFIFLSCSQLTIR